MYIVLEIVDNSQNQCNRSIILAGTIEVTLIICIILISVDVVLLFPLDDKMTLLFSECIYQLVLLPTTAFEQNIFLLNYSVSEEFHPSPPAAALICPNALCVSQLGWAVVANNLLSAASFIKELQLLLLPTIVQYTAERTLQL